MTTSFDTETHLIARAELAPRLVCVTWARVSGGHIAHRDEAHDVVEDLLKNASLITGANIPYDMAVVSECWPDLFPWVWRAYDEGRITDIQTRQKLIDIAHGQLDGYRRGDGEWVEYKYSLGDLVKRHMGEDRTALKEGPDIWRLRYNELDQVPVRDWPQDAIDYAIGDSTDTLEVHVIQDKWANLLDDEFRQARAHFALHLMQCRGIMVDRVGVARYEERTRAMIEQYRDRMRELGWLHPCGRKRKVKAVKEYAETKHRDTIQRTDKGAPSLSEESVRATEDPDLIAYQRFSSQSTILGRIDKLKEGVDLPLQADFNLLVVSGRTSCRDPRPPLKGDNLQNRQRLFGDRECFIPRPGFVFGNADYDGFELRTIAQKCIRVLGKSRLGEVLNEGKDPHAMLAAHRVQLDYDKAIARMREEKAAGKTAEDGTTFLFQRELAKRGNFAFDGGLGAAGFVFLARDYYDIKVCGTANPDHNRERDEKHGLCILCLNEADALRTGWFETWPEMVEFHAWIRSLCADRGLAMIQHIGSNRFRGHCAFTEACNSFSQGLGADATKAVLYRLSKSCYWRQRSEPDALLFGCFPVNYIHDEFILEIPDDHTAHDRVHAMAEVMREEANKWIPDVPTRATPLLMRRWSKNAKAIVQNGRLVPWDCEV